MSDERQAVVTYHAEREAFVVRVGGDIDSESAPQLAQALDAAERAVSVRTVVDLSGTEFADSSVLHVLLAARQEHEERGALMVVAGPFNESIERLFDVTGTAGFFVLADSVAAAMEVPQAVTER
ncbi:STAS domain-containing protein [Streptomyces sp. NPDC090306]|uniref:STAS domain-containing protein n=1 Tax=unclassified Streptomyces TaxID=2593676 RepID=UPI0036EB3E22